ncbi:hypothetical protein KL938_003103 [Ogataea parapolymorpha]|nr:hypothetical protein KL938_003103 [Ogataea parapolymorpha]
MDQPSSFAMANIYSYRSELDNRQGSSEYRHFEPFLSSSHELIDPIQYDLMPELVSDVRIPQPDFPTELQDTQLSMESPVSSSSSSSVFDVPHFPNFTFTEMDDYKFGGYQEPAKPQDIEHVFHTHREYDNVETINTVELTKPFATQKYASSSPVLKSQKDEDVVETIETREPGEPQAQSPKSLSLDYDDRKKDNKYKKISDSRLSLSQLSHVLQLPNDIQETAKREKQILNIFKKDLNFPLGEKTWIRDTPAEERQALIERLWKLVEMKYQYGYSKETLAIVIRRASYYLMQGRLRRERRLEKKKHGELPWKRKSKSY